VWRELFWERAAWITAIASATALAVLAARYFAPSPRLSETVRFELDIPATRSGLGWPEISPDGRHLAGVETGDDGVRRIWVRSMDTIGVTILRGTDGASYPFWSPDGLSIAVEGAPHVVANVTRPGSGKGLAIHLLNYDPGPVSNVKVRLRLDREFASLAGRELKVFTPDSTRPAVAMRRAGTGLEIALDRLEIYTVLTWDD